MMHAIILAGGWGRRLWPKSRRSHPKQLLCLDRRLTLIQDLFNKISPKISKERIWVVTNKEYASSLQEELPFLNKRNFLIEPLPKNTAAAIGLASLKIKKVDPQAVTLVLSSDQMFGQRRSFLKAIKEASIKAQEADALVVIGIRPNRPAAEYGYLKITKPEKGRAKNERIFKVEKFIEKPNLSKAKIYVRNKNYLWNSGIFIWRVDSIIKAIKKHLPGLYSGLQRIERAQKVPSQYKNRLFKEYSRFKDISIDYGVMEKAQNIYTVTGNFSWQDLGTWTNLSSGFPIRDGQGNIIYGLHKGIDTCDSFIFNEKRHLIATLGVRDLVIVHTPSATLVCHKNNAQDVKKLTEILEKDKQLRRFL